MLQRMIIWIVRIAADTFFRRIEVVGIENVPEEGPVIFAGNHPNALMDGFLLIARCGRWPLHFMVAAKLWDYRFLGRMLNAVGAVPVYRRDDHDGDIDNSSAFEKLYEVIEAGNCMGIFPEGISHVESQLVKLKTGAARIALTITERGKVQVTMVPCGLNYIHRHRFRSQVLIQFGTPIILDEKWLQEYRHDAQSAVRHLTDTLAESLKRVTLNAPDWRTLRFIQTARRLYKPAAADLNPGDYMELNRRFIDRYLASMNDPELVELRDEVEDYQSELDILGLKDHQLRQPLSTGQAIGKMLLRSIQMFILLPLAIPGAILHLPVGWAAAIVGNRFSYEEDDIATLKVLATILLLPLVYLAIAVWIGIEFGAGWSLFSVLALSFSFFTSVRLLEMEANLIVSMFAILRLTRLRSEAEQLREMRANLVVKVRELAGRLADPEVDRIFVDGDFKT